MRGKLVFGQIALDAKSLFAVLVEDQDGRRPEDVKAVKSGWVFLDMDGRGNKLFFDELCYLRVTVRFGFQPSAPASSRRGAEIEQDGTVLRLRLGECGVSVLNPVDGHAYLLF